MKLPLLIRLAKQIMGNNPTFTYSPSPVIARYITGFVAFILFTFLNIISGFAQTIPLNDNCTEARLLTPGATCVLVNSTSANATQSLPACATGGLADDDVWFKFVANQPVLTVRVNSSSNFDAVVEVFSGSCGNLSSLKCTDETGTGIPELVHLNNLTLADTFYVRVYHYKAGSGSGTFSICVSPPSNDYCEGAISLPVNATCVTTTGTTAGATQSLPHCTPASGIARDVWYSFVATSQVKDIRVTGNGNFNPVVELFSGNCSSLNSIHCEDITHQGETEVVQYDQFIPGQQYFVRVYDKFDNATNKTFAICVKDISGVTGAYCASAVTIGAIPFNSGLLTTCGKGDTYRSYCSEPYSPGEDYVFKLNVTNAPIKYIVKTTAHLYIYDNCPSAGGACLIPGITGGSLTQPAERVVNFTQNGTYYLIADNHYGCGNFRLLIEPAPQSPSNDECLNAVALDANITCIPINGTTVNATISDASACTGNLQDVWYKFTAKTTSAEIRVAGNGHRFELLTGNCQSLSSLNCPIQSTLTKTNLVIGQQYFVRVYNGSGNFTICLREIPSVQAPPPSDECAGAIPITTSGTCQTVTGTLANMTRSGSNCLNNNSPDAWYSFTASQPNYEISLKNLTSITTLAFEVLSGTCGNLQSQRCVNGHFSSDSAFARLTGLVPGNTYFVRVFAQIAASSTNLAFELCIKTTPQPPVGTTCQTAEAISTLPFNSGTRTTCNSGPNFSITCNGSPRGEDYLYKFTVSNAPVALNIHLTKFDFANTKITVLSGCPETAGAACVPGTNNIYNFATNGTYYLLVSGNVFNQISCGSYQVSIMEVPPTPANDNCSGAIPLTVNSTFVPTPGSSLNATQSAVSCSGNSFPDDDVWYSFVATTPFQQIKVIGSPGYNAIIQVYRGSCGSLTNVLCGDLPGNKQAEKNLYTDNLTVGNTYYVRVYHAEAGAGPTGQFSIGIIAASSRPAGSVCSNAVSIPAIPFYSGQQTTCGKGDEFGFGIGEDMVYSLNITNAPVTYQFRIGGTGTQKKLWAMNGCGTLQFGYNPFLAQIGTTIITANDSVAYGKITFPTNALYYLMVDSDAPSSCADFTLAITPDNAPAPANNTCATALPLVVNSSCNYTSGNLLNASQMGYSGNPLLEATAGIWYKFTPVSGGLTSISIKPSTAMVINARVSSGPCDSLVLITSYGRQAPGTNINFNLYNLKPGKEYFIQLFNYPNEQGTGNYEVCIFSQPALANDNCSGALSIPVSPYTAPVFTTGSSANAQPSRLACSGNGDDDVYYSFTATETRHKVVLQSSTGYDGVLEIFSGICTNLQLLKCADATVMGGTESADLENLTIGQTYFIKVHHQGTGWGSGNFSLSVQTLPTPPANNNCSQAILISASTTCTPVSGSALNATESFAGCSGARASDVWYKFEALSPEHTVTVQSNGDFDAVVEIFSGNCNGLSSMVCRDSSSTGGIELAKAVGFIPGETYYIRVYDYQNRNLGSFNICVRSTSSVAVLTGNPLTSSNTFCAGSSFRLPFRALGTFTAGNEFVAEISNASGSFVNAIEIGRKSGLVTDTIQVQLPTGLTTGSSYKLRVTATAPGYKGIESNAILTINSLPATPQVVTPPAYCLNEPIAALTAVGTNLKWYTDAQLTTLVGTGATFTPTAPLSATTIFYVTQTTNSCESPAVPVTVTIKAAPDAAFTGLALEYCVSNQPIALTPTTAGGTFSGNYVVNNAFIPIVPGSYTITYSLTQNGCTASTSKTVLVKAAPVANAGANQTMCSGATVSLGNAPTIGYLYSWSPVAGISNPGVANPNFTFTNFSTQNDTILKQITVTDPATGCSSSSLVEIVVKGVGLVSAGPDVSLCTNSALHSLTGTPTGGTWTGSNAITGSNFNPALAGTGIYNLVYSVTQNGCLVTDTVKITVTANPNQPIITLTGNTLTSNSATGNQWYSVTGSMLTPVAGATSQTFTPTTPGNYTVVVTAYGCESDAATAINVLLGISKLAPGMKLEVYPNPTSGRFLVELTGFEKEATLQLISITGQEITNETVTIHSKEKATKALDLSGKAKGVYLLKVISGENVTIRKVVLD